MKIYNAFPQEIRNIWRYPVKSMAGEEIAVSWMTQRGILGDRAYAVVDKASNRAAAVRTWATNLFNYRPRFISEPEPDMAIPGLQIATPDGMTLTTSDPDLDARLSAAFGRDLTMMNSAPAGLLVEFPTGTLGGALADATELPLAGGAPAGTFFDYACVHLVATSTLDHLQAAHPEGRLDVRRFRPNVVVHTQADPFVENTWIGRTIAIGDEVVLRGTIPCPRCINTTLPQDDLPRDPRILRTIAQHNMQDLGEFGKLPCVGVYADVVSTGRICRGDVVRCLD